MSTKRDSTKHDQVGQRIPLGLRRNWLGFDGLKQAIDRFIGNTARMPPAVVCTEEQVQSLYDEMANFRRTQNTHIPSYQEFREGFTYGSYNAFGIKLITQDYKPHVSLHEMRWVCFFHKRSTREVGRDLFRLQLLAWDEIHLTRRSWAGLESNTCAAHEGNVGDRRQYCTWESRKRDSTKISYRTVQASDEWLTVVGYSLNTSAPKTIMLLCVFERKTTWRRNITCLIQSSNIHCLSTTKCFHEKPHHSPTTDLILGSRRFRSIASLSTKMTTSALIFLTSFSMSDA